jgi:hypothetical protein
MVEKQAKVIRQRRIVPRREAAMQAEPAIIGWCRMLLVRSAAAELEVSASPS